MSRRWTGVKHAAANGANRGAKGAGKGAAVLPRGQADGTEGVRKSAQPIRGSSWPRSFTRTRAWTSTRSARRCGFRDRRSIGTSRWANRPFRAGRDSQSEVSVVICFVSENGISADAAGRQTASAETKKPRQTRDDRAGRAGYELHGHRSAASGGRSQPAQSGSAS